MRFQDESKEKISRLAALSLFFSYAEFLIPKAFPFLRLGLSNAAVLLALDLPFAEFFVLILIKTFLASLTGGTLFSPFVFLSLSQSISSGLLMFFLSRVFSRKMISLYGISVLGAVFSAVVQIFLSSLYVGKGVFSFLGIMILFSVFSGVLTAFLAEKSRKNLFQIEKIQFRNVQDEEISEKFRWKMKTVFILIFVLTVFLNQNIFVALFLMILAFVLQKIFGRKIFFLSHLGLWIFILISCIFSPSGKVIFSLGNFSVTEDALFSGILKAFKLSAAVSISQIPASFKFPKESFIGKIFFYYSEICKIGKIIL